jgi:actin-related protein
VKTTVEALMELDENVRKSVLDRVVLSGGNTMFAGFEERFTKGDAKVVPFIYIVWGQQGQNQRR